MEAERCNARVRWTFLRLRPIFVFEHHHLTPCLPCPSLPLVLQQKNTCAHNNTHKAHANGIKKKKRTKYVSTRGMDPKFLRNQKFCKKWNNSKRPSEE